MVLITLLIVKRSNNNTVTDVPVLIPCPRNEQEGLATFLGESGYENQPVRILTDADLEKGSKNQPLREMWDTERKLFAGLVNLLDGLREKDQLAITRARERLIDAIALRDGVVVHPDMAKATSNMPRLKPGQTEKIALELSTLGPRSSANEKWLLSTYFSEALDSVRLVLWWSGTQFRPALYCPDLKSALYTFVLMRVVAGRGWGVCPFCGLFFVQIRSDQNYCSIAHREAHRVARWRAAKKGPTTRKRGRKKNGTRKTR
jgi:hypothetical protein